MYKILSQIKNLYFKDDTITLFGKLNWLPIAEKRKTRYFQKFGKELKAQYTKYEISQIYSRIEPKESNDFQTFHYLLISPFIESKKAFYIVGDSGISGRQIGDKRRYKFCYDKLNSDGTLEGIRKVETKILAIR